VRHFTEHQRNCAATRSFADVLSGCKGRPAEDCFGSECLAGSRSRGLPETKREAEVQRLGRSNTQQPFDWHRPLLRLTLLRLSTQEHVLLLTMHHIISDAWSVFIREAALLKPSPPASLCRQNSQSNMRICRVAAAVAAGRCSILS